MFRKIKYRLLMWLLNDIFKRSRKDTERLILDDIRGPAHVHYMAIKAWNLNEEKEKDKIWPIRLF